MASIDSFSESMTIQDVGDWLHEKGFPIDVQEAFENEEMDGEAVIGAFGSQSWPDCLRDVLPKYGQRIKVYKAIKSALGDNLNMEEQKQIDVSPLPETPKSTTRRRSTEEDTASVMSSQSSLNVKCVPKKNKIPDPFPVPQFRETTEEHLSKKQFGSDDRRYMVRVLATMLLSHITRPSMRDCEHVAKALVHKFPFLEEYHSWAQFVYTRCQNCNRKPPGGSRCDAGSTSKKQKLEASKHQYPSLRGEPEDDVTHSRNVGLLKEEMAKAKPSSTNLKGLMSWTFLNRREWILNEEVAVSRVIKEYPCVKLVSVIAHEMDAICDLEGTKKLFEENWEKYIFVIIKYALSHTFQSKDLRHALRDLSQEDINSLEDGVMTDTRSLTAVRCLVSFLLLKSKKKSGSAPCEYIDIPFLLVDAPNGTPLQSCLDKDNNHPYIVRLYDGDRDVEPTYQVVVEQDIITRCRNLSTSLFVVLALHYIFNIAYQVRVHDILQFLQEVVFNMPSTGQKKSATYASFCTAIKHSAADW